jgi:thioester reductase-like protein
VSEDILLTGATGFFGAFLLSELVKTGKYTVTCLVRAADETQAWHRLRRNMSYYQLSEALSGDTVKAVSGDLSQPFIGLSETQFDELAKTVSIIYHNGALVSFLSPPSRLRSTNVDSTLWLVTLATTSTLKKLHYISSISAGQDNGSAYGGSKRQAEQIVMGAAARGLFMNVYRLPRLAHDSRTGMPNEKDIVFRMLDIILRTGFAPNIDLSEDWIPVDLAANALVETATKSHGGKMFSLAPRTKMTLAHLLTVARENGFDIHVEQPRDWVARIKKADSPEDNLTLSGLGMDDGAADGGSQNDNDDSFDVVDAPDVSRDMLVRYFNWYRAAKIV